MLICAFSRKTDCETLYHLQIVGGVYSENAMTERRMHLQSRPYECQVAVTTRPWRLRRLRSPRRPAPRIGRDEHVYSVSTNSTAPASLPF